MNLNEDEEKIFLKEAAQQLEQKKNLKIINSKAGKGAFGYVMIVEDYYKRQYAIKIQSVGSGNPVSVDKEKLELIKREASILKQCNHQHIVKCYDEYLIGFNYFILMEKCEKSLYELIDKSVSFEHQRMNLTKSTFLKYALQMVSAVSYLHESGFVLRDISLTNILLDKQDQIKFCDFGSVKQIDSDQETIGIISSSIRGSLFYFSPEIRDIAENSEQTKTFFYNFEGDVWSLGICFYLMAGGTFYSLLQFTREQYQYQLQHRLGDEINEVISGILQRNPKNRPTVYEITQSLNQVQLTQNQNRMIDQGRGYLNNKQFDEAIKCFKRALEINSHSEVACFQLGVTYSNKKMYFEAIECYKKVLEIKPNDYKTMNFLGNTYRDQKMSDEAIVYYKRSLEINPDFEYSNIGLGFAYQNNNMLQEAKQCFERAIEINPNSKLAYNGLGNIYDKKNMLRQAITSYQRALQIDPNYDVVESNLGNTYLNNNQFDEALACYQRSKQINPNNYSAHNGLGLVYKNQQMYEESISSCKKAIEINPNLEGAHICLGDVYFMNKMKEEAIKCYERVLQINPHSQYALDQCQKINGYQKRKINY